MNQLLEALRDNQETIDMLAIVRDEILDHKAISEHVGHDVLPEMVASPEHVVYYAAVYIEMLKRGRDG